MSTQQPSQNYGQQIDTNTLRTAGNVYQDERFGNEILARAGPSSQYQHPQYRTQGGTYARSLVAATVTTAFFSLSHTPVISSDGRLENLNIQSDNDPLRVVKPADQNVHYKQQVNVRFLEPPPGPEPAPIIIKVRLATRDLYAGLHSLPTGTTSPSSTSTATLGYSSTATNTTDTSSSHHP